MKIDILGGSSYSEFQFSLSNIKTKKYIYDNPRCYEKGL